MFNLNKVSTKILIPVVIVAIIGNLVSNYISTKQMEKLAQVNTRDSLEMLTSSIFLTLRNAMNTGDPAIIKSAENKSRETIKGLESLVVAKSKKTIELYSPDTKYTTDKDILEVFATKKEKSLDIYKEDKHIFRVLKPMIATQDCLLCHANEELGAVIGVIDLSFSLDSIDELIDDSSNYLFLISIIIIAIILSIILLVVNRVTRPLKVLKDDLGMFFQFLSKERDTIEPFKVESMDEIGQMIQSINENIEKTIVGINQDTEAIKESSRICELVSKGDLSVKIQSESKSKEINDLIDIVNKLIASMSYNVNRVLDSLDEYSKDHYSVRIVSKGKTNADMKRLFDQVNILGETLVKLSSQNLKNGLALEQTSSVLSSNVENLSSVLTEQSNSLSNVSEELKNVILRVDETSKNSIEMTNYANELANSSNEGKDLASSTVLAMDEINNQVMSINEAIIVIDQIAFQTNILSLNAAVEAATAGEAGKGFAVVAQEVRSLASRSAEAAKEIKELVENAKVKAEDGKVTASNMIDGYSQLSENVESTTQLINLVAKNSKEQQGMINEINNDIQDINVEIKKNVEIANETNVVAHQASDIAHIIVVDASEKNFCGKEEIQIRDKVINVEYKGEERRRIESNIKNGKNLSYGKRDRRNRN